MRLRFGIATAVVGAVVSFSAIQAMAADGFNHRVARSYGQPASYGAQQKHMGAPINQGAQRRMGLAYQARPAYPIRRPYVAPLSARIIDHVPSRASYAPVGYHRHGYARRAGSYGYGNVETQGYAYQQAPQGYRYVNEAPVAAAAYYRAAPQTYSRTYAVPTTVYQPVTRSYAVPVTTYQQVQRTEYVPTTVYRAVTRTCTCEEN